MPSHRDHAIQGGGRSFPLAARFRLRSITLNRTLGIPKDFKLNFGGIVGAVVSVVGVVAIVCLLGFPPVGATPIVLAAAAGGALGNWIWSVALPDERPRRCVQSQSAVFTTHQPEARVFRALAAKHA